MSSAGGRWFVSRSAFLSRSSVEWELKGLGWLMTCQRRTRPSPHNYWSVEDPVILKLKLFKIASTATHTTWIHIKSWNCRHKFATTRNESSFSRLQLPSLTLSREPSATAKVRFAFSPLVMTPCTDASSSDSRTAGSMDRDWKWQKCAYHYRSGKSFLLVPLPYLAWWNASLCMAFGIYNSVWRLYLDPESSICSFDQFNFIASY